LDTTPPTIQPQFGPLGLSSVWQTAKNISEASDFHDTIKEAKIQKWLVQKQLLDLSSDGVIRWKLRAPEMLFQSAKHMKVHGG
jgi:hypothetical protein